MSQRRGETVRRDNRIESPYQRQPLERANQETHAYRHRQESFRRGVPESSYQEGRHDNQRSQEKQNHTYGEFKRSATTYFTREDQKNHYSRLENKENKFLRKQLKHNDKALNHLYKDYREGGPQSQYIKHHVVQIPARMISNEIKKAEQEEGNEAIEAVHKGFTLVKDRAAKPFITRNFGSERHQTRYKRSISKSAKAGAKKEIIGAKKRKELSVNPISRILQKRKIKKRAFARQGLKKGGRLRGGIKGAILYMTPFQKVQNVISVFQMIASAGTILFPILVVFVILIVLVAAIAYPIAAVAEGVSDFLSIFDPENWSWEQGQDQEEQPPPEEMNSEDISLDGS